MSKAHGRCLADIRLLVSFTCLLAIGACTNIQPSVTQFGQAATTTVSAENAMFDGIDQRKSDVMNLCILSSSTIDIGPDAQISPKGMRCGPSPPSADDRKQIPPDVRKAINGVLSAIQAYGQALQDLAGDTAATTLNTNVDSLGKSLQGFDTAVLTPLGGKGLPTSGQINAVGTAIKEIGDMVVSFVISKDVKSAAQKAQEPLRKIAAGLKNINGYWTAKFPTELTNEVRPFIIGIWGKSRSIADKESLAASWQKAAMPISPDAANKALDNLVAANDKVASAGPNLSVAEIKSAWQAANDAYVAYKALTTK